MPQLSVVHVAVPGPFLSPLDYLYHESEKMPVVGGRVWVSVRHQRVVGVVIALGHSTQFEEAKLKNIHQVIDQEPLFTLQQMRLFQWASYYYHEPIGDVISAALPKRLKQGKADEIKEEIWWSLTPEGRNISLEQLPARAHRQRSVLTFFQTMYTEKVIHLSATMLAEHLTGWQATVRALIQKGWLQQECFYAVREIDENTSKRSRHVLNEAQRAIVDSVVTHIQSAQSGFIAYLLEGITGSGKTEVYLEIIDVVLAQGKQVLVLVPEIGLTPQMVRRFEAYLGFPVALLHSGLNETERHRAWHRVRTGQASVLLGTRSAIFTPFKSLGLCIIDEEHDLSYKQQEGFRYSARDLIVKRASQENIPVILGSATPSLESLYNVHKGQYHYLALRYRAGQATLPGFKILDIRGEKIYEGISQALKAAIQTCLNEGGQTLLFLNRRGFAPVLMCHACGWQARCPSCDANMTLHSGQHYHYLLCHHCAEQMPEPDVCPNCGCQDELIKIGQGTERLHNVMKGWFPEASILRIDRDTTRQKGKMASLTRQAQAGEADILIGTQMLAKGHDFPNVTLVGILDIDQGLFSADYRASERMAQLIIQVAGRAGRAHKKGQVWIQTHQPEHSVFTVLIPRGYHVFAQMLLQERCEAGLPPYSYQIMVRAEATEAQYALDFLQSLKAGLTLMLQKINYGLGKIQKKENFIELLGPVPAPMLRRQGRYRFQLLIQATQRKRLHQLISEMVPYIYKSPLARKVRWSLDVDPQDMM